MERPLTSKQQRFVAAYIACANASQAAREAGYSLRTADHMGYENLKKPQIAAAIAVAKDAERKRSETTLDDIRKMHLLCYKGAVKAGQWGAANKAAESIGKMLGAYVEKRDVNLTTNGVVEIEFVKVPKAEKSELT